MVSPNANKQSAGPKNSNSFLSHSIPARKPQKITRALKTPTAMSGIFFRSFLLSNNFARMVAGTDFPVNPISMRILSGIQPSGTLHIGNHFGAIKQWIALQKEHECLFLIVDLHAITEPHEPKEMQQRIRAIALDYLS